MSPPRWPWLALCCLAAASAASPRFGPSWSRLPAGTEIPELRTSTSHTFSNGDGTFTADITPLRTGGSDSQDSCQPTSTGWASRYWEAHSGRYFYGRGYPDIAYGAGNAAYAGYAKFDLSSIPDSGWVVSAQLHCYQYEFTAPLITRCTYLSIDPDSVSDTAVYSAVLNGPVLAERQFDAIGWFGYELSPDGVAILQDRLHQDWVALGIKAVSMGGHSYGIGDDRHVHLHVVYVGPSEADIQAVRAELLTYPAVAGAADTALLVLTNKGLHTSDQFWAYATSEGLARESTLVGVIAVGETASVRLPIPLPDGGRGFVDYSLWSACRNDPWPVNDTTAFTSWIFPRGTYMAEGFEQTSFPPPGWAVVDNDTGRQCWERRAGDGLQHSGDAYAFCQRESGRSFNDDWLMTGPVCPSSDCRDSVGVCYRSHEYPTLLNLQVWALDGQTIGDTISCISQVRVADTAYHWRTVSLDEFDGDTIYIGFRNVSGGSQIFEGLCLDDIWFSRVHVPGTCEPQDSVARQPDVVFTPNPMTGRFVTVQYDIAAEDRGTLALRDVLGRTVKSYTLDPSGSTRLDLRGFAPGIYMATLNASGVSISRKLVLATP